MPQRAPCKAKKNTNFCMENGTLAILVIAATIFCNRSLRGAQRRSWYVWSGPEVDNCWCVLFDYRYSSCPFDFSDPRVWVRDWPGSAGQLRNLAMICKCGIFKIQWRKKILMWLGAIVWTKVWQFHSNLSSTFLLTQKNRKLEWI